MVRARSKAGHQAECALPVKSCRWPVLLTVVPSSSKLTAWPGAGSESTQRNAWALMLVVIQLTITYLWPPAPAGSQMRTALKTQISL